MNKEKIHLFTLALKYVQNNNTELTESLDIVLEEIEHDMKYPSVAEDTDRNKPFADSYVIAIHLLNSSHELHMIPSYYTLDFAHNMKI